MKSTRTTIAGIVALVAVLILVAGEALHWGLSDELRGLLLGAAGLALSGGLLAAQDHRPPPPYDPGGPLVDP